MPMKHPLADGIVLKGMLACTLLSGACSPSAGQSSAGRSAPDLAQDSAPATDDSRIATEQTSPSKRNSAAKLQDSPNEISTIPTSDSTNSADATWPGWRGPTSLGLAPSARLPTQLPQPPLALVWKTAVGSGWSSPVVARGTVIVTDRAGGRERVLALDASTGKPKWEQSHPVDFDAHPVGRRHGNGPKSTAVVVDEGVLCVGIAGSVGLYAIDDGKPRWELSLPEQFGRLESLSSGKAFVRGTEGVVVPVGDGRGAMVPLFGYTGSPLAADGKVVLSVGQPRGGTIMAFDFRDGSVEWQALEENVSYSSPIVANLSGRTQIVVMTGPRVVGLDLADGELLWSYPFQIQYDESISTPVAADDLVLVTGDGKPLTALAITTTDGRHSAKVAWRNRDLSSYLSSMVVHAGHVYGMNDGGELVCVRLNAGETVWTGGAHGYYCTPVLADDKLVCQNERGKLLIVAADPTAFRPLAEYDLGLGATWTSPAIVGSRLYVRGESAVACFDFGE